MEHARATLHKVIAEALQKVSAEEAPMCAWGLVAGAAVAERTRTLAFEGGILRVGVPDAGWKSQLADMAPQYLAAMNRLLGGRVKRIQFEIVADLTK